MKKMKKFLTSVLVIATLLISTIAVTSCGSIIDSGNSVQSGNSVDSDNNVANLDDDTEEAAFVMKKAVEKIDSVSEMLFSAAAASSSTDGVISTAYIIPQMRSSAQVPNDISFSEMNPNETIVRQLYVNYPYNIVNYMLQNTTKAHKLYNHKYKVGQTVYGVATKTINDTINRIFETPSIDSPTLAINVQKEKDGISFIADWDWRNDILAETAPRYNSVVMANAKVEYDHKTKEIDKITMTWYWTEQNGEFMASVMDFENNEFYFLEGWRKSVWNEMPSAEALPDVFNRGELTYEKLCEYSYSGIHVIKSNITSDVNNLEFKALSKSDKDINSTGSMAEDVNGKEAEFAAFYNEIYQKVQGLKIRNERDYMSLDDAIEVDFMNDAATYGLNKTKCVTYHKGIEFLFIDYENLQSILSTLAQSERVKNNQKSLDFINGAKGCLDGLKNHYIGELGEHNGKTYTLEYVLDGNKKVDTWRLWSENFVYKIGDGENFITFELEDKQLINARVNGQLVVGSQGDEILINGLKFTLNLDGQSYSVAYHKESDVKNIVIPETYGGLPVTKIADEAFDTNQVESITIPASITSTGVCAFSQEGLKKINFLGTVNQWAEIDFNILRGAPTQFTEDLYINGELLTSATITSTKISDFAFIGCKSLESVVIGDNVQSIGANAFARCSSLGIEYENAYYIGTEENPYKVLVRAKNTDITSIQLHADTEILSGLAFEFCRSLENIKLNEKLTTIGEYAFYYCESLREMYIPASVTEMSSIMLGYYDYFPYNIRFIFEEESEWYCSGGKFDGEILTTEQMIILLREGNLYDSKFIRKD